MRRLGDWRAHLGRDVHLRARSTRTRTSSTSSTRRRGSARTTATPLELAQEAGDLIARSGLKVEVLPDLRPAQWSKLIFNATVNGVAALTGLPHDFHFAQEDEPAVARPARARADRRGQGGCACSGDRVARRSVGDERARDAARPRALPVDARGRRGRPADGGRADQRRARPRGARRTASRRRSTRRSTRSCAAGKPPIHEAVDEPSRICHGSDGRSGHVWGQTPAMSGGDTA